MREVASKVSHLFSDEAALVWLQSELDAGAPEAERVEWSPGRQEREGHVGLEAEGGDQTQAGIADAGFTVLHQQLQPDQVYF